MKPRFYNSKVWWEKTWQKQTHMSWACVLLSNPHDVGMLYFKRQKQLSFLIIVEHMSQTIGSVILVLAPLTGSGCSQSQVEQGPSQHPLPEILLVEMLGSKPGTFCVQSKCPVQSPSPVVIHELQCCRI